VGRSSLQDYTYQKTVTSAITRQTNQPSTPVGPRSTVCWVCHSACSLFSIAKKSDLTYGKRHRSQQTRPSPSRAHSNVVHVLRSHPHENHDFGLGMWNVPARFTNNDDASSQPWMPEPQPAMPPPRTANGYSELKAALRARSRIAPDTIPHAWVFRYARFKPNATHHRNFGRTIPAM